MDRGGRGRARAPGGGDRGGRGHVRAPGGGDRGRARGPRGRGRGRARGVQEHQAVNFGVPEHLLHGFGVPEHLLDQSTEVDQKNQQLSGIYIDIQSLRDSIGELREVHPNDKLSHEKLIKVCLDEYTEMRTRGAELRDLIHRMDPPGIPFEEPEGFDVMP